MGGHTMSHPVEENKEDNFKWGKKLEVTANESGVSLYESFTYGGVGYSLFDNVYVYQQGCKETGIGKILKICEKKKDKKVKLLWFLRPVDIRRFLKGYQPAWNELFLASGEGKGLCNVLPLEAILGKCSVMCTSKDRRNTLPSKVDLDKADYFFSCTFDVGNRRRLDKFPDKIAAVKVEHLLNRPNDKPKTSVEFKSKANNSSEIHPLKKRKIQDPASILDPLPVGGIKISAIQDPRSILDPLPAGGIKSSAIQDPRSILDPLPVAGIKSSTIQDPRSILDPLPVGGTKSSAIDRRRWFITQPWEQRVNEAREKKTLVYLDNLDPLYTSSDVQGLILTALKVRSDAKIIPHGYFSSPSYGRAMVIFESKDDADFVISELRQKCLMVGDGRPVFACRKALKEPDSQCSFPGHLVIEKLKKWKWSEDKKKAVSTSHCAQPGTIEYDMAIQWRLLQSRSAHWWKALHEQQASEILNCQKQLRNHQLPEHEATLRPAVRAGEGIRAQNP